MPPVGMRREYILRDMFAPFKAKNEKEEENKEKQRGRTEKQNPKELITASLTLEKAGHSSAGKKSRRPLSSSASLR